jgi:hypothetical protein
MILRFAMAAFLVLHAAIHLSFFMPQWFTAIKTGLPFNMNDSWILATAGLEPGLWEIIGTVLVGVTIAGLVVGAAGLIHLVPVSIGLPALTIGAVASLVTIALFFNTWLFVGGIADVAILAGVAIMRWLPEAMET